MHRLAIGLALFGLAVSGPAAAQSDAVTLSDVQAAYDALDGLRASFTQLVSSDFAGDTTRIEGTVLLSGNRYRVQTPDQTVVTDGETTWIYSPADSQVVVNDAGSDATQVTPETFLTASADRYRITASSSVSRAGAPHVRLSVTATDSTSRFGEATLWVRRSDRVVTRMRAADRNGSTLDLRLDDIDVNPALADSSFTFSPPEGIEVVDLRRGQ
jgi:outer membrane lipoprotein carrier protein